jgi:hypothetical protein
LEALGEQTNVLHKDEDINSVVFDSELDTIPYRGVMVLIGLGKILNQAPCGKGLLLFIEPCSCVRVIRQDKGSQYSKSDGDNALL